MLQEAQQAELHEREAEVARLSEPRTRDHLTAEQLAKLSRQEAEIAELRQRLEAATLRQAEPPAAEPAAAPADEPAAPAGGPCDPGASSSSSRQRHHIIDVPPDPALSCRQTPGPMRRTNHIQGSFRGC